MSWFFILIVVILLLTTSAGIFLLYYSNSIKKQKNALEVSVTKQTLTINESNKALQECQSLVVQQNAEIFSLKEDINEKNKVIDEFNHLAETNKANSGKQQVNSEEFIRKMKFLSEFGNEIASSPETGNMTRKTYQYVKKLMDVSSFGIGFYNHRRNIIEFRDFIEYDEVQPYFYKDLDNEKSLTANCFNNKREILINEMSEDYKQYLASLRNSEIFKSIPSSVIHLPLFAENSPIGTISVSSTKENAYTTNDVDNLRTLASYIAIAIDNSKAYRLINQQNEQIKASIRYGLTIQHAMLPAKDSIDQYFNNFIIFKPKETVSGDFYWFAPTETHDPAETHGHHHVVETHGRASLRDDGRASLMAVVDCTGHGIPGAFMSMIGNRLLNEIVIEQKIYDPPEILTQMHNMLRHALRQDETANIDGMDMCVVRVESDGIDDTEEDFTITFAGAKRPLYYYKNQENKLYNLPGSSNSVGGIKTQYRKIEFRGHSLNLSKGDMLYLSTDGFSDQCDAKRVKFGVRRLISKLGEIGKLSVKEQEEILSSCLEDYQGNESQRDDITFLGLQL